MKTLNFGIEKQLDRIVETLALSALMASKPNKQIEKRLKEIAFPLEIEFEDSDASILFESEVIDDDL